MAEGHGYTMIILVLVGGGLCLANLRWSGAVAGLLTLADLGYFYSLIQDRIAVLSNTENQFQLALARTVSHRDCVCSH
jgi:hypothetical protein